MGLIVSIYKDKGRSYSNGGFSERHDEVTVVNVEGPFEPTEDRPPVMLVKGNVPGTVKVVPAIETPAGYMAAMPGDFAGDDATGMGPMMGGTYVGTSDSRFSEAVEALLGVPFYGAVPFHDRFESAALYAAMSQ